MITLYDICPLASGPKPEDKYADDGTHVVKHEVANCGGCGRDVWTVFHRNGAGLVGGLITWGEWKGSGGIQGHRCKPCANRERLAAARDEVARLRQEIDRLEAESDD